MENRAEFGEQLCAWAYARLGQQVGAGRSWELAQQALRSIGLDVPSLVDEGACGQWGAPVTVADARPGDILLLRDYAVVAATVHTARFDDGTSATRRDQSERRFAQQVAIIAARPDRRGITVLTQGTREQPRVEEWVCLLRDVGPIKTRAFQRELDAAGELRPARVTQHTTLHVTGSVQVFRPAHRT